MLGVVLPVGIQRDGVGEAQLTRLAETFPQGIALTSVGGVVHQCDALKALEQRRGGIRGAVVDHDDIIAERQRRFHHLHNRTGVVVRRDDNADASRAQELFLLGAFVHVLLL